MAEFTSPTRPQAPADYGNLSQGIRSSGDRSLGVLFEGLAGVLGAGVQEADRQVQEDIREDVFAEVDAIQDEFGVGAATLLEEDVSRSPLPRELEQAGYTLDTMAEAAARGALKESHYWARMNSMVRQLRSKYPGYRAEIDQMVSGVTGARPANALRSALFSEYQSAASKETSDREGLIDRIAGSVGLPADFEAREFSGNPYSRHELTMYFSEVNKQKYTIDTARSRLALAADQGSANKTMATQEFNFLVNNSVHSTLTDVSNSLGSRFTDVQAAILDFQDRAARNDPIAQEELAAHRATIANLRTELRLQLELLATSPLSDDSPESFSSLMSDPSEVNRIIDQAMAPIQTLEDALVNENFGAVGAITSWMDARKLDGQNAILSGVPMIEMMNSLRDLVGDEVMSHFLTLNPALQDTLTQTLLNASQIMAGLGRGDVPTFLSEFSDKIDPEQRTALAQGMIDGWVDYVTQLGNENISVDLIKNHASFLFGRQATETFDLFEKSEQITYWKQIASPAVTANMVKLLEMGETETWDKYTTWVTEGFMTLFRDRVQNLQDFLTDPRYDGMTVKYNPQTHSVEVTRPRSFLESIQETPSGAMFAPGGEITREVQDLSTAIRTMVPILEVSDLTAEEVILEMLTVMGYDPLAERDPGFYGMLWDAVVSGARALTTNHAPAPAWLEEYDEVQGF